MKFLPHPVFCNKRTSITYSVYTKKIGAKISHVQFSEIKISFTCICYYMGRFNGDCSDWLTGQLIGPKPKQKD